MGEPWQLVMFKKSLKKRQKFDAIVKMLKVEKDDRCIDICSGDNTGALSYYFRELGGNWHTGDLEPENQEVIKEILKENVYFLDPEKLPFDDNYFDNMILIDTLEHMEDERPLLNEVKRVLKENGSAIFTVPNQSPKLIGNRIKNAFGMRPEKYGHRRPGYTREELIRLLETNGFTVRKAITYGKFYTEMVELGINLIYMLGSKRKKKGSSGGEGGGPDKQGISPTSKEKLGTAYKIYSKLFPVFKLISKLDKLLVFSSGYNVVVEAGVSVKKRIVPESFREEKVLVTGGGGFIGSHLVEFLLEKGYWVRTVDVHTESISHLAGNDRLEIVEGDYLKEISMDGLIRDIDIVFHLASAHLAISVSDRHYEESNLGATGKLIELCRGSKVKKFIYCSTVGVMGDTGRSPANEDSPLKPETIYEKTKLMAEDYVKKFHRETGYPVVVVRPSWTYGPRCPRTIKLFRSIRKGRFFMVGNGKTYRQSAYISDLVRGIWLASQAEKAVGNVYILSGDEKTTVGDLVSGISGIVGKKILPFRVPPFIMVPLSVLSEFAFKLIKKEPFFSRRSLLFYLKNYNYDISRAKRDLGYEPQVTLKEGLEETYRWMIENGAFYK
ncbi:MAG: NAD-dependent epimerase/dehydratase family protein [Actinobacteria bacterium]|nr:NAD-dependent epimerase/dehydratase family protein [Actinomycetota bacterium]